MSSSSSSSSSNSAASITFRKEKDSLGFVSIPVTANWGPQTQRSLENFPIGDPSLERMPKPIIKALCMIKVASARLHYREYASLSFEKASSIEKAALQSMAAMEDFPLSTWQTGSGTQSNMNVNEVIARRANAIIGASNEFNNAGVGGGVGGNINCDDNNNKNNKEIVHPNDDVNRSQSSNDTFPTAMSIATLLESNQYLLPGLETLIEELESLCKQRLKDIIKVGRTHLQDACPLRMSDEFGAYVTSLKRHQKNIIDMLATSISSIAQGGTAVGSGINTPSPSFGAYIAKELNCVIGELTTTETKIELFTSKDKFEAISSHSNFVSLHGELNSLSTTLLKMANDIRMLAMGPRAGIGEISLKAMEPGSSIMPGKVNPTQVESIVMVCCQVMGNNVALTLGNMTGHLQLNCQKPLIAKNLLQSIRLLGDSMSSFGIRCVRHIQPRKEEIEGMLKRSLMLVTALNPHIGYDNAAKIAKLAFEEDLTLRDACIKLNLLSGERFDELVCPEKML